MFSRATATSHLVVTVAVCAGSGFALADERHPYGKAAAVCVTTTVRDHLSGPRFNMLRKEASRIWIRHGIELNWTGTAGKGCDSAIPLVFDHAAMQRLGKGERDEALARTVFAGPSRTIYVSVPRATRMVALTLRGDLTEEWRENRGGTLLGRVVAHELGHALLRTTAHAATGLMRPVYGLGDVLSDDERMTQLTRVETQRLAMLFSLRPVPASRRASVRGASLPASPIAHPRAHVLPP